MIHKSNIRYYFKKSLNTFTARCQQFLCWRSFHSRKGLSWDTAALIETPQSPLQGLCRAAQHHSKYWKKIKAGLIKKSEEDENEVLLVTSGRNRNITHPAHWLPLQSIYSSLLAIGKARESISSADICIKERKRWWADSHSYASACAAVFDSTAQHFHLKTITKQN